MAIAAVIDRVGSFAAAEKVGRRPTEKPVIAGTTIERHAAVMRRHAIKTVSGKDRDPLALGRRIDHIAGATALQLHHDLYVADGATGDDARCLAQKLGRRYGNPVCRAIEGIIKPVRSRSTIDIVASADADDVIAVAPEYLVMLQADIDARPVYRGTRIGVDRAGPQLVVAAIAVNDVGTGPAIDFVITVRTVKCIITRRTKCNGHSISPT